jgi:Rha family phage regulatory protein
MNITIPKTVETKNGNRRDIRTEDTTDISMLGVFERDSKILVSSLDVARVFEKKHQHIIRNIRELIDNQPDFGLSNFGQMSYEDSYGRPQPEYLMTRDGFFFIAMGFTGDKADTFKIAYITAFNEMENALRGAVIVKDNGELSREEYLEVMRQMSKCSATFYLSYMIMFRDLAPNTYERLFGKNTESIQPLRLENKDKNNPMNREYILDVQKFHKLLSEKNVSYCELAKLTRISKGTCYNYWHGKTKRPSAKNVTLIADTLNVNVNYFLV